MCYKSSSLQKDKKYGAMHTNLPRVSPDPSSLDEIRKKPFQNQPAVKRSNVSRKLYQWRMDFFRSHVIRHLLFKIYRSANPMERKNIKDLINDIHIPLVVINFHSPHLVEHIKELFWALKAHSVLEPIPVTSIPWVSTKRKRYALNWFEKKYGLIYGKNLFPNPWIPIIRPACLIDMHITPFKGLCKCTTSILCPHGLAAMGFGKDPKNILRIDRYDYLFLSGPLQKKALVHATKKYGGRLPKLVKTGFLRGDRLISKKAHFDRHGFMQALQLDDRFTVLYAPTWGKFSSAVEWIEDVATVCNKLDLNLLLRLHPRMLRGRTRHETGGLNWDLRLKEISKKYSLIRVITDDDIDDCLLASDLLITDVSSLGIEFMLLGKPVVFLASPDFFNIFGEDMPIAWVRKEAEVKTRKQLTKRLEYHMSGGVTETLPVNEIIYNPGRSLEVMLSFLEENLQKESTS